MKIAIVGGGKMGAEIGRLATQKGIDVARVFTSADNAGGRGLTSESLVGTDVVVEFTNPVAAFDNIRAAAKAGKPIVVGTTGWEARLGEATEIVNACGTGLVHSPNFSLGLNILVRVLDTAARLVDRHEMYDVAIRETHHRGKADSPSGTALHLGRNILKTVRRKTEILAGPASGPVKPGQLHISSERVGHAVGEHTIVFDSEADTIEITHRARNRSGFAQGALVAAAWVHGRKGVFTMDDVLSTE